MTNVSISNVVAVYSRYVLCVHLLCIYVCTVLMHQELDKVSSFALITVRVQYNDRRSRKYTRIGCPFETEQT
jgi:hypothetical protein